MFKEVTLLDAKKYAHIDFAKMSIHEMEHVLLEMLENPDLIKNDMSLGKFLILGRGLHEHIIKSMDVEKFIREELADDNDGN